MDEIIPSRLFYMNGLNIKLVTIIVEIIISCWNCCAQTWTCDGIADDIRIFNEAKSGNKKWANHLKTNFPLNKDNQIELTYVLQSSDSIHRLELVSLIEGWLGTVFTNARDRIEVSNESQLICSGDLGQVAFDQKFIGATRIMAPIEIQILYKPNRIRLSLLTRNYRMAYANIGQLESGNMDIGSVYPFLESSKHKEAYAMAFINTISKLLNLSNGCLHFLNKHSKDSLMDIPEW